MFEEKSSLAVVYGMAPPCLAELPGTAIQDRPTRDVILEVAEYPQTTVPRQRAARIVREVVSSGRPLDIEVSRGGTAEDTAPGKPVKADEILVPGRENSDAIPQNLTVRMSEPLVGGLVDMRGSSA